ncbi:MAG: MBL fold metallo-hydrolase [Desulfobacterales bacterium]
MDPFITGNPGPDSLNDLDPDYIFVSHGHGDHVGDTVDIAKRTGATVSTPILKSITGWRPRALKTVIPSTLAAGLIIPGAGSN